MNNRLWVYPNFICHIFRKMDSWSSGKKYDYVYILRFSSIEIVGGTAMFKKKKIFLGALFLFMTFSYAESQNKFSISGEVKFPSVGNIMVGVYTQKAWGSHGPLAEPAFQQIIKLTSENKNVKKVLFRIDSIPKDTYAIFSYQDKDKNGKFDRIDPWGVYKEVGFARPDWDKVKFQLNQDISGIEIELAAM